MVDQAVIDFPLHTDRYLEHPLDVTTISGDITLRSGFMYGNGALSAAATHLTVASGGGLRLEGFTLLVRDDFKIEGTLVVDRAALAASVDIASGGLMLATNAVRRV